MFSLLGSDKDRAQSKSRKPLPSANEISDPEYKRAGHFDKEDVVILVLTIILVVSTIWLATRVL